MWAASQATSWMDMEDVSHFGRALIFLSSPRQFSDFFDVGGYVGEGGFSTVLRCKITESGLSCFADLGLENDRQYAVKCMVKNDGKKFVEDIGRSLHCLSRERHMEFIRSMQARQNMTVRLIGIFIEVPAKMFSLMELLEGPDLFDFLATRRSLVPERQVRALSEQTIRAVHYIHFIVGALHRDIKPENFGFVQPIKRGQPLPRVKLMDFGSAWVLPAPVTVKTASELLDLPPTGTEQYMSPECIGGRAGPQSDVWGAGIIAHMLLCMDLPFGLTQCPPSEYKNVILGNQLTFDTKPWTVRSQLAKNWVELLLDKDPAKRPNTMVCLDNAWFKGEGHESSDNSDFEVDKVVLPDKSMSKTKDCVAASAAFLFDFDLDGDIGRPRRRST